MTVAAPAPSALSAIELEILRQLRSLRFGQVTVQVHDARVVQIERTEKLRPEADDARVR
jgi:hypothetical protein